MGSLNEGSAANEEDRGGSATVKVNGAGQDFRGCGGSAVSGAP